MTDIEKKETTMRDKMWMTVWSGGYEAPSYQMHFSHQDAMRRAAEWATTMDEEEGDTIDVLELDIETGLVTRLAAAYGDKCPNCGGTGILTVVVAGYATSSGEDEAQSYPCPTCGVGITP